MQNKYCHTWLLFFFLLFFFGVFFVACSATVASRDSLPVIPFKEKGRTLQVLNVAEVRRECVRRECVRSVPARCQRGGILKQPNLSSSSVILSLHSQMSEFCLPLSFFLLQPSFSFTWQATQQKHQSLFVNVNCRWPNNLGVSESVDCFELNLNVYKPLCSLASLSTGSSSLSIGHAFLCCYIVITAAVYEVMKGNTCCWNRSTTLSCLPCKSMGNIIKY